MKDALGDRMKGYEEIEAGRRLIPLLPALARIDGRCFSSFTKDMHRPYDERLSRLMIETTKFLVEETCACVGYTQSDEISLAWVQERYDSEIFFCGRIQKMVSQLGAMATLYFNNHLIDQSYRRTVRRGRSGGERVMKCQNGPWQCPSCGWYEGHEDDLQSNCQHEYEWKTQPGTPSGQAEHFKVCKHCGAEELGNYP